MEDQILNGLETDKCCNIGCTNEPKYLVFWPGQRAKAMCDIHAKKAKEVANVMGIGIPIVEISKWT